METLNINHPEFDDEEESAGAKTWLVRMALVLVGLLVLAAIGYALKGLMAGGEPQKKTITKISLKDLPPPPPPPPPKEQPKEQPKDAPKEIKEQPQPKPVEAPPAEQLKMEGAAGDGPSPFAAGAVNNEYKGGEVKTIGKPNGSQFAWYAGIVKSQIEDALAKDKKLTEGQYKLQVSVWLKPDGRVDKVEWVKSNAGDDIEALIKAALTDMPAMREPPPADMPQPIRLRITARKIG